jgi:heat shock protein HslJ
MSLPATGARAAVAVLFLTLAAACQTSPGEPAPKPVQLAESPQAVGRPAPTLRELKNAIYSGVEEAGASFELTNGKWEGKPYEPGGASLPSVSFAGDFRVAGDLNGDGAEEAVVLLTAGTGGTGEVWYLAVVGKPGGQVTNIATTPIGDRVQVRDAKVDGRRIVLDLVQAGENDAACCPGDLVARNWELAGAALKEGAPAKTGRLSVDVLAGTEWVLKAWAWEEAAPEAPEVTLRLDGGRLAGSAGCNGYFAPVTAGGSPGDLRVGPAGSTRKMCPEAEMAVEQRFLGQLAGVTRLRFVAGQLALPYTKPDKSFGVMLFDRRAAQ